MLTYAVCGILEPLADATYECVRASIAIVKAVAKVKQVCLPVQKYLLYSYKSTNTDAEGATQPDGTPTLVKIGVSFGPLSGGVVGLEVSGFTSTKVLALLVQRYKE